MILLISFSLNPNSKSFQAVEEAHLYLKYKKVDVTLIDIRNYVLSYYDGTEEALEQPHTKKLVNIFNNAEKIIIATPVYNYDVNAVFKNFIDILSAVRSRSNFFKKQVIGMIGAMGSKKSFVSLLPTLSNLQLSLGVYLIPKLVMCTPNDFHENSVIDNFLKERIQNLCDTILNYTI